MKPEASLIARWVSFWDEREPVTCLAVVRIALALVVLVDLLCMASHGAVTWLWAPAEAGGISTWAADGVPFFYRIFPRTRSSALLLWVGLVLSIGAVGLGFFTRPAALVYVWLSAQTALIAPPGDRAIDRAIRIFLLIIAFSAAGQAWSLDARRKTGRWRGSLESAPAWPRYLLLGQLVLIYAGAGLAKGGTHWYPWGGYRALYLTLQDPILARGDFSWLAHPLPYLATQIATATTHLWELAAPLVLIAAHFRRTRARGGVLRRLFERVPVRELIVGFGVAFHLALAASLRLGIFPFAMLACFPAFFTPGELARAGEKLRPSALFSRSRRC